MPHNTAIGTLERKFFVFAQYSLMLLTILVLVGALAGGIYGIVMMNASGEKEYKPPVPSYEKLKQSKAEEKQRAEAVKVVQDKAAVQQQQQQAPQNKSDIPVEYIEILGKIEKSLMIFAQQTRTPEPSSGTRLRILESAQFFENEISIMTQLTNLEAEARKMEADAPRIAALSPDDAERITWDGFLSHFFETIKQSISSHKAEAQKAQFEAMASRKASQFVLIFAGFCFFSFLFLTTILVLLSTERNTRACVPKENE